MSRTPERAAELSPLKRAYLLVEQMESRLGAMVQARTEPIAVIGMGCRFPGGADSPEALWQLLSGGVDAIGEVPADRWKLEEFYDPNPNAAGKMYTRWGGFVRDVDKFDQEFFRLSPREIASLDPQQRLLMEVSWEALEYAGQVPSELTGTQTGVFVGISTSDYSLLQVKTRDASQMDIYTGTGQGFCFAAGRLSYMLGLQGPCLSVDTACSSSLVTVHLACQSLRNDECRMAIAGGINLMLSPEPTIYTSLIRAMAPDGRCKTFDAAADGYVRGEGCGVLILKRLSDALADGDRVLALIRGSAVNHDGPSGGLTVPNGMAQRAVIRRALENSGVEPSDVSYVEAHGTGTSLGDPIELRALAAVLGQGRPMSRPVNVGSIKTNIGHLEAAAGVAGVLKVILSLMHEEIPPHLNLKRLTPHVNWDEIPLAVPTERAAWPAGQHRRIAGVSSFGMSGTNAHVILEEAPRASASGTEEGGAAEAHVDAPHLLPLSARNPEALRDLARAYHESLAGRGAGDRALRDVCYTAGVRRTHHEHRLALAATSVQDARGQLESFLQGRPRRTLSVGHKDAAGGKLVFAFSGQGSQWHGMGRRLLARETVFRQKVEECDELFRPYAGRSLSEELRGEGERARLERTDVAQPAIFALQVALASLWRSWGVEPDAVVGHSLGEVAAAHVAGALSLSDAVRVVFHRARLMEPTSGLGGMAAVELSSDEAEEVLRGYDGRLALAASNGPASTVLAGPTDALEDVLQALGRRGLRCQMLPVNYAFHSPQMEGARLELVRALEGLSPQPARIPVYSTVTGEKCDGRLFDAAYWGRNVRETVRFNAAVVNLLEEGHGLFLEVGPHPVLLPAVNETLRRLGKEGSLFASLRREEDERLNMLSSLGGLYALGRPVEWRRLYPSGGRIVRLPSYTWQRRRFWLAEQPSNGNGAAAVAAPAKEARANALPGRLLEPGREGETVWETELDAESFPYLSDHRVQGRVIVPGALYAEMALSAAPHFDSDPALKELRLHQPLLLRDGAKQTVRTVLTRQAEETASYQILSRAQDAPQSEPWAKHATGLLLRGRDDAPGRARAPESLDAISARCAETFTGEEFYRKLKGLGLQYGPCFRPIEGGRRRDGEALAPLSPDRRVASRLGEHRLHPVLLDACFQLMAAALPSRLIDSEQAGLYLPVGFAELRVFRRPGSRLWAHASCRADADALADVLEGDVRLLDETGEVVAEVSGLRQQRVTRAPSVDERETARWLYEVRWLPEELTKSAPENSGRGPGQWLIFADGGGVAEQLAARLAARGESCVMLFAGESLRQTRRESLREDFVVNPSSAEELREIVTKVSDPARPPLRAVCHLWSCDAKPPAEDDDGARTPDCASLLHLVKALDKTARAGDPRLWLVTAGAQPVIDDQPIAVAQTPLWGLGRVVAREHQKLRCSLVDLSPSSAPEEVEALLQNCLAEDEENQIALRGGVRYVARLFPHKPEAAARHAPTPEGTPARAGEVLGSPSSVAAGQVMRLEIERTGSLGNLSLRAVSRRPPRAGEVEIEVEAAGLNFRDIMKSLGVYPSAPGDPLWLGDECAGRIVGCGEGVEGLKVGDEVIAAAPGSFARMTTTAASYVCRRPRGLSAEECATIPIAFTTAYHALRNVGQLCAGERVLIHAAAGGVGLAAVQIAQWLGAEIFATAGSDEKREFLRSLGVRHVMDTRSLRFAGQIMELTGGAGVDVVLNSLSGEAIAASLSVLGRFGRFVEIGKRDIYEDAKLGLLPFKNNLSFSAIDLELVFRERPDFAAQLLREVVQKFEEGVFRPLPLRVFHVEEAVDAFRHMALRRNIGKVVVSLANRPAPDARRPEELAQEPAEAPSEWRVGEPRPDSDRRPPFDPDGAYLITGGLGGLGLLLARWMAGRGARRLYLLGRSEPSGEAGAVIRRLREDGVEVTALRADVADREELSRALQEIGAAGVKLRGVAHAAGVLDDCTLLNMDDERLNRVLRPKVDGAWNLHRLTRDARLDFFVLFSSAASLLGSPGQGNYAAANAFLDGLAHYRRRAGLPALSLNWGAWAQAGMAANAEQRNRFARLGVDAIEPDEGLEIFGRLVGGAARQVLVLPADWQRLGASLAATGPTSFFSELTREGAARPADSRPAEAGDSRALGLIFSAPEGQRGSALEGYLQTQLARVVGLKPAQIDPRRPLADFGFDSLIAMELVLSVESSLGLRLPMESLSHETTLSQLAELALPLLKEGLATAAPQSGPAEPHARVKTGVTPAAEEDGAAVRSSRADFPAPFEDESAAAAARLPELDETAYEEYVRPRFARMLAALKLDRTYVRAEGDRLTYEEDGRRVEVLDMVGGYGSTLFGHNHPELVAYARELLAARIPIQAQGSLRGAAGTLARALSERVKSETGRDYMCVFGNSGAEAIEAAIKHAALEYIKRGRERAARDERAFALLAHRRPSSEPLPAALVREIEEALGGPAPREPHAAQRALDEHNEKVYETMPLFLALGRSFHGKTLGALSLTANPLYRGTFLDEAGLRVDWVTMGDGEGLRRAVESERRFTYTLAEDAEGRLALLKRRWTSVGAIFVEPVQGEGGIHVNPPAFFAEIQALAEEDDFPVVVDEIQSGMGRCGSFMASRRLGLRGDYYALAKSLGGGLAKIGALLVDRSRYDHDFGLIHTSTFAEDDYASLLALKSLEILDRDGLVARCEASGNHLLGRLRELQTRYPTVIKEVRGMGLMVGVELAAQSHSSSKLIRFSSEQETLSGLAAGYLLNEERIRAAITLSSPNTIRLEPSAYVSGEDLDSVVRALERLCQIIERANAGRLVRYLGGEGRFDSEEPVADWRGAQAADEDDDEEEGVPRAAFFGHLIEEAHLTGWDASLAELPPSGRGEFLRRIHRFVKPSVTRRVRVRSALGREMSLRLVSWVATSSLIEEAMRDGETGWLLEQLTDALEEARGDGCQVVGFGGYLSIVSQNCKRVATTKVALTTGNAYTVAMGLEALRQAARERGIDLKKSRLAAVGAGGNICSTYLRVMAEEVPELTLVGRRQSEERMAKIAMTLYQEAWERIRAGGGELGGLAAAILPTRSVRRLLALGAEAGDAGRWLFEQLREEFGGHRFIRLAEDLSALADCDVVVTASNSATPIIFPEHLSRRPTIVCDISVPPDVSPEVAQRCPDALVLKGGVVRLPHNDDFMLTELPLPPGHMYACMAETTLLGLESHQGHFSFGDVSADDVRRILEVGRKHGYQLGYLKSERTL